VLVFAFAIAVLPGVSSEADVISDAGGAESPEDVLLRIGELTGRIADNPKDVELLIELGNIYYEMNMLDDALATYITVTEIDSTHAGARLNLGTLYTDMGELGEAVHELELALGLDPENPMIVTNLGSAYYGQRRYSDAVDMYRVALHMDPDNVEAHFNLGVAFADGQVFDEAVREWEKVIELSPGSAAANICKENILMINEFRGDGKP
jgi:tetratricopeptide (TPR) repeat protein